MIIFPQLLRPLTSARTYGHGPYRSRVIPSKNTSQAATQTHSLVSTRMRHFAEPATHACRAISADAIAKLLSPFGYKIPGNFPALHRYARAPLPCTRQIQDPHHNMACQCPIMILAPESLLGSFGIKNIQEPAPIIRAHETRRASRTGRWAATLCATAVQDRRGA
jgi:hypothetical protein